MNPERLSRTLKTIIAAAILLVCTALTGACCRKPMLSSDTRDSTRVEYRDRYSERVIRDTAYVRDSIFVRDRGDTVVMYRDRYHYVDRFVRDTVRLVDTVYQTVYRDRVVVEVQRHVPALFRWSMAVAIIAVGWIAFTLWRRVRKP